MTFKMTGECRTVTVYNLRADTNEFIGQGDAFIPAFTGLPAHCTTVKPPESKDGFIFIFDTKNGKWEEVEDHRGEIVFDTETGSQIEITEPGGYPVRTTTIAPENAWQKWDGISWVDDTDAERNAFIEEAQNKKIAQLKLANEAIETLQDAVDFDMATDDENESLVAWKKYRVLLSRVKPTDVPDIEWPESPTI